MPADPKALPIVRSYGLLASRLKQIARRQSMRIEEIGVASGYPCYALRCHNHGRGVPYIFLSAGTHGDEPAAVEALLQWLESDAWHEASLFVLPCINPWGYERNRRHNEEGVDINRTFREGETVESAIVMDALGNERFDLAIELHEDVDSTGFYLYEIKEDPPFLGESIIKAVEPLGPINRHATIEGLSAIGGVIRRPKAASFMRRRKRWPLAFYLYAHHTAHKITLETPVRSSLNLRIAMHRTALHQAFDFCCKRDSI